MAPHGGIYHVAEDKVTDVPVRRPAKVDDEPWKPKIQQKPQWRFLSPLIWAPVFPIIRLSFGRISKRLQPYALATTIIMANFHAFFLIMNPDLSDEALDGVPIGPSRRALGRS